MFTGIIEAIGKVGKIEENGTNKSFWVESNLSNFLKIDQSLSHNGVCLTVEEISGDSHKVTAIAETLNKTALNDWKIDTTVNLERCMLANGRFDGHFVSGHIDTTATCTAIFDKIGSWEYVFEFSEAYYPLIIEKGSITINGISLTIFNIATSSFTVAIIPYTYANTNMQNIIIGSKVNIEFDLIGKYIARQNALTKN